MRHAGDGFLQFGAQAVELAFRDRLAPHQVLAALVLDLGQAQFGLSSGHAGLFHIAVELHQRLVQTDFLTGVELQVVDRAAHFHRQLHTLEGFQAADGRQQILPGLQAGGGGADGNRWPRSAELLDLLVNGDEFSGGEGEYREGNHTQHGQHAAAQHSPNPWLGNRGFSKLRTLALRDLQSQRHSFAKGCSAALA